MNTLGAISLTVAFVVTIYAAIAGFIGGRRNIPELIDSARNGVIVYAALTTIAWLVVIYAFVTHDFSLALVANHSSRDLSLLLTLTAVWSGQAGSLLFWTWILSLYGVAAILRNWTFNRDLMPYAIGVLMTLQIFFAFMLNFVSSPFKTMEVVPLDGAGLNPLLTHPLMSAHPPLLYLGYIGFTVPYVFAMAALISGRITDSWIRATRRWTLIAWMFLGLGLLVGGRWAYDVLGWGGYWGWDPVENSALMPWLTGTAFLHSVMVQERKGTLKVWNLGLVILAFTLTVFGTFLTRAGIIQSVHAFATSEVGAWFLGFIALVALASMALLFYRLPLLRTNTEFDALLSREMLFLLNNVLFLGAAIAILIGVIWPLISELITGQTLTVGPPYFNLVVGIILVGIFLLMGIIPLIGWGGATLRRLGRKVIAPLILTAVFTALTFVLGNRDAIPLFGMALVGFVIFTTLADMVWATRARQKNTREHFFAAYWQLLHRNHRRYGGYLIHLAIAVMAIGVIGSRNYATDEVRAMQMGESWETRGYMFVFENFAPNIPNGEGITAQATLGVYEDGRRITTLTPSTTYFPRQQQNMTNPAIYGDAPFFRRDVYAIIQGWEDNFEYVSFRVYVNPMMAWVWMGGLLYLLATVLTMFPDPQEVKSRARNLVKQGAYAFSKPSE
ncbi:MAG TPA: cytochrome c-type biogenesis CcmF C-terminal domain-containing protein [Anaerolineae bacterium]|nr:cytochrome c-type biogenesis CcmF C-terminal domain-containing protein [Anaerolineae bacterium]